MSLQQKKKKCVLCATVRNEGPWLLEWIAYHRVIGFDSLVIVSNDNCDGSDLLLNRLDECGIIKYIPNDNPGVPSYSIQGKAYRLARETDLFYDHEWACVLDADEFLVLNKHETVKDFLEDYDDLDGIVLSWLLFGSSGRKIKTKGLVMERFVECNTNWRSHHKNGAVGIKSFGKIASIETIGAHLPRFKDGHDRFLFPNRSRPIFRDFKDKPNLKVEYQKAKPNIALSPSVKDDYSIAYVNHYQIKSYEEFFVKKNRYIWEMGGKKNNSKRELFDRKDKISSGEFNYDILKKRHIVKQEIQFLIDKCDLADILLHIDDKYNQLIALLRKEERKEALLTPLTTLPRKAFRKAFRSLKRLLPDSSVAASQE